MEPADAPAAPAWGAGRGEEGPGVWREEGGPSEGRLDKAIERVLRIFRALWKGEKHVWVQGLMVAFCVFWVFPCGLPLFGRLHFTGGNSHAGLSLICNDMK